MPRHLPVDGGRSRGVVQPRLRRGEAAQRRHVVDRERDVSRFEEEHAASQEERHPPGSIPCSRLRAVSREHGQHERYNHREASGYPQALEAWNVLVQEPVRGGRSRSAARAPAATDPARARVRRQARAQRLPRSRMNAWNFILAGGDTTSKRARTTPARSSSWLMLLMRSTNHPASKVMRRSARTSAAATPWPIVAVARIHTTHRGNRVAKGTPRPRAPAAAIPINASTRGTYPGNSSPSGFGNARRRSPHTRCPLNAVAYE